MERLEQLRIMAEAERAFLSRFPKKQINVRPFANPERPELRQGDWLIVGVFGEHLAVEIVQYLVCVNLVTGERRIVRGWQKAYALKGA